jgi:hypothetical protein
MLNVDVQEEVGYMRLRMWLRYLRVSWSGTSVCSEEVERLDKGGVLVCSRFALPQQLHRRPEETSKNRCRPLCVHTYTYTIHFSTLHLVCTRSLAYTDDFYLGCYAIPLRRVGVCHATGQRWS